VVRATMMVGMARWRARGVPVMTPSFPLARDAIVSMNGAMRATANRGVQTMRATTLWTLVAIALTTLAVVLPVTASAAATKTTHTDNSLGLPIPASERVHGTGTTPASTTPASVTPASTTPASTTPASAAPAATTPSTTPAATTPAGGTPTSGAQPGTVAPAPATTVPTSTTPTATTPTGTTPAVKPGTTVVGVARGAPPKSTRLSTAALALVILGALLVLGCLAWALSRWLALEPRWMVSLMHSLREASYRASATWAEFSDWVRLGH
jgi:hypothetical protein